MRLDSELIILIKLGLVDGTTRIDVDGDHVVKVAGQPKDTLYRRYRRELKKYQEDNVRVFSSAQMDFDEPSPEPAPVPVPVPRFQKTSDKLGTSEVCDLLGISRSTLLRLRKTDDFPKAIQLNQRTQRWHRHELEEWAQSRART